MARANDQAIEQTKGRALFVYYKIAESQEAALLPLVRNFQQELRKAWPRLSCELMQRPAASPEGLRTWMEVYRHGDLLTDQVIDGISRLARDMQLPAPRFAEIFVPLQ